jgi:4-carboxymuconolactone decarboxylase
VNSSGPDLELRRAVAIRFAGVRPPTCGRRRQERKRLVPISGNRLGGRLPLMDRSALTEPQQQLFDQMTKSVVPWAERAGFASRTDDGRFIGPFNPSLLSPVISGQFLAFQAAEEQNTSLTPRQRQVVILAVGAVWHSAYELFAHSAAARTAGLPAETVRALAAGQMPGDLSAAEQAAWRFARQLTADRRVDQPVYDQAQAAFSTRGIADMLCLIGAYQTVCGILNAFEIPAPQTTQAR